MHAELITDAFSNRRNQATSGTERMDVTDDAAHACEAKTDLALRLLGNECNDSITMSAPRPE
jgi:hypothetical protein